jgi:hypothetical protein
MLLCLSVSRLIGLPSKRAPRTDTALRSGLLLAAAFCAGIDPRYVESGKLHAPVALSPVPTGWEAKCDMTKASTYRGSNCDLSVVQAAAS